MMISMIWLQAVYFDKRYHNLTSARLWWDLNKSMFDSREQLMTHAFKVVTKPVVGAAVKVRDSLGASFRRSDGAARLSVTRRPEAPRETDAAQEAVASI